MKIAFICLRVQHDGKRSVQDLAEHAAQRAFTMDHVSDAVVVAATVGGTATPTESPVLDVVARVLSTERPKLQQPARTPERPLLSLR